MCHPSHFLPDADRHRVAVQQPVPLPHLLLQLGLGHAQLTDGRLHLLHLHLHQCDDVPLLVQFPQQLGGRGAGCQRVRVVQRAAGHTDVLHRQLVQDGGGIYRRVVRVELVRTGDRRRVTGPLRGSGQPRGAQVLTVLADLHHGDGVVARLAALGSFRRGAQHAGDDNPGGRSGAGGSNPSGHFPASAPPAPALVHAPQREEGRHSDAVGLPATCEVHAADSVPRGGLEGAEAAADPGPGDVPQPQLPQRRVLRKRVEAQVPVPVRVVVAAGHTAGEAGHVYLRADGDGEVSAAKLRLFYCCFFILRVVVRGLRAELHVPQS